MRRAEIFLADTRSDAACSPARPGAFDPQARMIKKQQMITASHEHRFFTAGKSILYYPVDRD
jgi:hypothetical protein